MATARLTTAFQNLDTSPFNGYLIAVLTKTMVTTDTSQEYVRQEFDQFVVKNGQAYQPDGVTLATLPVTQAGSANPGNVPVTFYLKATDGRKTLFGSYVIPLESGGNPVNLASLVPVAVDAAVVPNIITGIVARDEWSSVTAYVAGDVVVYGGSTWFATQAGTNQTPSLASTYWGLLVEGVPASLAGTTATTYAASVALDFLPTFLRTLALTGDVTITGTSNRSAGKAIDVKIAADGTARNITFPASWKFLGQKPTAIGANKTLLLSLRCYGTNETDVVAAAVVEL